MTDPFEELIAQLGQILEVDLHLDHNQVVALTIREKLTLQIQEDRGRGDVLIASALCEIPPGKFRENVLAEALKANSSLEERPGTLGYLAMKNSLTLHKTFPMSQIEGAQLASLASLFIDYAERWQQAIQKGQVGPS